MKKIVLVALLAFASNSSQADEAFRALVERIQGEYQVEKAGGKAPKAEVDRGEVVLEENKAEFNFPYCPEGADFCEAGYRTFSLEATQTELFRTERGISVYTFSQPTAQGLRTFEWVETEGGAVWFRDLQHRYGNAPARPLTFQLKPHQR